MVIDEFDGLVSNQIYEAALTYLGTKISPSAQRLKISKTEKENNFIIKMESNEVVIDTFSGVKLKWVLVVRQVESSNNAFNPRDFHSSFGPSEVRSLELSFPRKHKEMVVNSYLPHVLIEAKSMKQETQTLKLFTVDHESMYRSLSDAWRSVNLDHPSTFNTLALDKEVKNTVLQDLERFVKSKGYYKKVGKAWKRGYLLYGPPGTGKSSLTVAMANYLNFDIYDLELTELRCNSELRRILVATANRSILVVEDIDCTIEFQDRMAEASAAQPHAYPQNQKLGFEMQIRWAIQISRWAKFVMWACLA